VGARFSAPIQTGLGAHLDSCTMETGSFPGVKSGRGVMLSPYPLLVPWSRKGRAIPLLPLWAVRPVQSLSACTWVAFTLLYFKINSQESYTLKVTGCVIRPIVLLPIERIELSVTSRLISGIPWTYHTNTRTIGL
jgi:hypothetical protein